MKHSLKRAVIAAIQLFIRTISLQLAMMKMKLLEIRYRRFRRAALLYLGRENYLLPTYPSKKLYAENEFEELDCKILERINFLQFGQAAENAQFLISKPFSCAGFGASLLSPITCALLLGYLYNRVVLYNDRDFSYDFCFEPIGVHSLENINTETTKPPFNFLHQTEKNVHFEIPSMAWGMYFELERKNLKYGLPSLQINFAAPLRLPHNHLYVSGLILDSFLQLKEEYQQYIEARRHEIGFEPPVLGLHIRHGGIRNFRESYRLLPLEHYFQTIERMVSETGIKTVFVTSDSPAAIRQLPKDSGINFIYDDQEIRYDNLNAKMVKENPTLKKQETQTAIKNILLLAECDYIIGTYSNFIQYALSISYHRNKRLNGILMRKQEGGRFDLEYITHGDARISASPAPIPSVQPRHKFPWLH